MKLYGSLSQLVAAIFRKDSNNITLRPNQSVTYSADRDVQLPEQNANSVLVSKDSPDVLTNKSISGATNTLSSIPNNATTATDANTPSAIVARNASGNFSAGTITADLVGNASTATSATSATSFTGSLSGEVTGTQSATVVADNVIDNDNIKSTAAIAYSKLALTGSIVSADLAGSIDATKIGSGSVSSTEFGYLDGVTSSIQTQLGGKAASGANSDITSLSGLTTALSISQGGTGQTSASAAINALLPSQATNFNKYLKTDGTNVSWASASGGAGEINAVLNASGADGTSGWINGTSHSINTVTGATIPLSPAVPTAFTMSSSAAVAIGSQTSSSGDYYEFTMPPALRNRKLKFEFYYTTPAAADGTWGVAVYNGATKVRLSTDTGATPDTVLPAGVSGGKFTAYFDTDSGTTYRVNFVQRTRTNANVLWATSVIVGPGIQPQGATLEEWKNFVSSPTATGFGTIANTNWKYRRVGDSAEIRGVFQAGTVAASTAGITLPSGFSVDTTKVTAASTNRGRVGRYEGGSAAAASISSSNNEGVLFSDGSSTTTLFFAVQTDASGYVKNTGNQITGSSQYLLVEFTVPIAEWAGSGTVQLAQNDVEYAFNSSTSTTSDTTSFGYGPTGIGFQAFAPAGTASVDKRVRFQTPIQSTDVVTVEIMDPTTNFWAAATSRAFGAYQTNDAGTVTYGISINDISGSNTDIDVNFFSKTGNKAQAWSDLVAPGWKWRVRKSSAGAAVGFGIVSPGTSAGLVSAAGLPGNTTGNAIASGYVGEVITGSLSYASALNSSSSGPLTITSVLLTPGRWMVSGAVIFRPTSTTFAGGAYGSEVSVSTANVDTWPTNNTLTSYPTTSNPSAIFGGYSNALKPGVQGADLLQAYLPIPPIEVVITTNTTYRLTASTQVTAGAVYRWGHLIAHRIA